MRVTSHCVNHPSKEAQQRCRSCRKWLCEACFQRLGGHIYCGKRCRFTGVLKDGLLGGLAFGRRKIHPAWVIAMTSAVSAALLAVIGLHIAELVALSKPRPEKTTAEADRRPAITAEVLRGENGRFVRIEGDPGTRVLVLGGDQPISVLTINDEGATESSLPTAIGDPDILQLVTLSDTVIDLDVPPLPTPSPKATSTPTITPGPTTRSRVEVPPVQAAGPTPTESPPVLQLIKDAGPRIALTFDGNASSNRTGELLDLLQELDLNVTLFVTGEFIERYPEIIRRTVLSGHEIGNHTFSHPHLTTYEKNRRHSLIAGMTRVRFQNELRKTEQAYRKATGRSMMPLWRAPFGEENRALRGWALEMGYLHIRWSSLQGASLDSRDWVADEHSSMYQNSSTMMDRLLRFPELRGGIILMHLATHREEAPWKELPSFVGALRDRGVEPTTVMQLLESSPTWRPWLRRAQARHRETVKR